MACQEAPPEEQPPIAHPSPTLASTEIQNFEYDFVEELPQDFFCPVTLELLIDPQLTMCCGSHLSQEAANRLKGDGKPCPMCKDAQLNTVPNKHFKRKVNEIKVRCPHKKSGCEWVGEINEVKQHSDSCPKRPWQCQYCDFETLQCGVNDHFLVCTKYPIVCPNSCEVGSVPCCDLEAHLMECPLQLVTCEYAEVGCDVKVPRRDLGRHMKEGQQQHLLSATFLNLRLTRENNEERNRLLPIIEEKDKELTVRDELLKEKDKAIADLQKQLKQVQDGLEAKVTSLQHQITKTQEHLKRQDRHLEYASVQLGFNVCGQINLQYVRQGFSVHDFTLSEFKKCRVQTPNGNWQSEPFYYQGYKIHLHILTNGWDNDQREYMVMLLKPSKGDHDGKLNWPVVMTAHVLLLNQLGEEGHHEVTCSGGWTKDFEIYDPAGISIIPNFFKLSKLGLNAVNNTQYLKNDCLQFRVYFKAGKK